MGLNIMSSPMWTDEQLKMRYDKRPEGISIFLPSELGYQCPQGHGDESIVWSEFSDHIWCYTCNRDYLYYTCTIKCPSWMDNEEFFKFIKKLPVKPIVVSGVGYQRE